METSRAEGKRSSRYKKEEAQEEEDEEEEVEVEEDDDEETDSELGSAEEHGRNKRRVISNTHSSRRGPRPGSSAAAAPPCCQADDCHTDLRNAKQYHRRHKVCEFHAKAPVVLISGNEQRFCQQCSRFHELSEFDNSKRSCRRRLQGHNARRRKVASDYHGEGYP